MGFIFRNAFSRIDKDDDFVEITWTNIVGYAKSFRLTWDSQNWNSKSTKDNREKKMQAVGKYHELEMIHG